MIKLISFAVGLCACIQVQAQQIPNWQNQDLQKDSLFGISTDKAYTLLQGRKATPVIVAVIDAGVDTLHEDLKSVLWLNAKKKKGDNGTYGWSFIGSAKGNVHYDNLELTRQVRQGDTTLKKELARQLAEAQQTYQGMRNFEAILNSVTKKIGKENPGLADFKAFQPDGPGETQVTGTLIKILSEKDDFATFKQEQIDKGIEHYKALAEYQLNIAYDPRSIVGDDYLDSKQHNYGSADNNGPDPTHGTHVSGIIAAVRHNGIGLDGIADQVKVMNIRAVPDGDERDKDIANAIRYAADHGAKVINMSFGKSYSSDKKAVDEAMKYALKKDVLLVQAAGNDNHNIDSLNNFPNRKVVAGAWIVVGASGLRDDKELKAPFSNYGKTAVDVFAPGVQIYSSIPGSKYAYFDGTSMACPVVAGLAALIREYYPKLKATEVKDIILKTVVKRDSLTNYCLTGGVVNAYQALLLAATYTHRS
ncbi:Subtilase family protein [Mucilaginibacter pineti]|uniref:Subtilase family protein n=1 Tax=Mucilaginibacter pineti TaxID=1391627 RepID=A0A1G7GB20_9SPHI|nr:S8 family serine peptidase [Mucilaginibacter pineti]SDE85293.1 Subtilase family protein [Mucilaginibacter pineti]